MRKKSRILIAGAGDAGKAILAEILGKGDADVVGFTDDDLSKIGTEISGVMVIGSTAEISSIIKKLPVTHVIIAMPSAPSDAVNRITSDILSSGTGAGIHIVPAVEKYFDSVPLIPSLEDFSFSAVFGREETSIEIDIVKGEFSGKIVAVTGAGGSIGSELCRQLLKFGVKRLVAIGRGENSIYNLIRSIDQYSELMTEKPEIVYKIADVKDSRLLNMIFKEYRPDIVLHAAAHKHVPLMEYNEFEAVQNNCIGTMNVLEASYINGVESFVLISTDKAVKPANVMGGTKRIAELITEYYGRTRKIRTSIVRFGNVIGSRGSVIPLFMEQIRSGGPVTVTDPEVTRYFMTIPEASLLVLNASALSEGGEIFMLDMGNSFSVKEIAATLIKLYGPKGQKIDIEYTGLRPGEKMHEELSYSTENLKGTSNRKIFILEPEDGSFDISSIEKFLSFSGSFTGSFDRKSVREFIKSVVPDFKAGTDTFTGGPMDRLVN